MRSTQKLNVAVEVNKPLAPEIESTVTAAVERHADAAGGLLPMLHQIQEELRYVPEQSVPIIARALNVSRAEVHGVISYYHSFTSTPKGIHTIEVCRAESCQAMGSRQLEQELKELLNLEFGETTADGQISLEEVYCLGNCACSPSLRINDQILGRATKSKAEQVIKNLLIGEKP